jgi:hypothetical protein
MPHAEVHLDDVALAAADLMAGDGYLRVVKPFRSIEDLHVNAATLAYLLREGRRLRWPAEWVADALATLAAFDALADQAPDEAATHVALEGTLRAARQLAALADGHWSGSAADPAAARWTRDSGLLGIASAARAKRFANASAALGLASPAAGS